MDTDDVAGSRVADHEPTYRAACPSRDVVDVLANKWVLYVMGLLRSSAVPLRFNELMRRIEGVSQRSLTKALRALERDGLIARRVYPSVPPRVEYRLTPLGYDAGELLSAIESWAKRNADAVEHARDVFDRGRAPA